MARKLKGSVVSKGADKTIIVKVESRRSHKLYHKQYTVSKRYPAHDEKNEATVGDVVEIVETRPISKTKHFKLETIVKRHED